MRREKHIKPAPRIKSRQNFDIMKKGGAHGITGKAQRRADKIRLNKEW